MLDKLQTWQLPYLYSIKIELSISGHEINEKKAYCFKQNANKVS